MGVGTKVGAYGGFHPPGVVTLGGARCEESRINF